MFFIIFKKFNFYLINHIDIFRRTSWRLHWSAEGYEEFNEKLFQTCGCHPSRQIQSRGIYLSFSFILQLILQLRLINRKGSTDSWYQFSVQYQLVRKRNMYFDILACILSATYIFTFLYDFIRIFIIIHYNILYYNIIFFYVLSLGDSPSSKRMYDVLNFGCIPVVLSDELVWVISSSFNLFTYHYKLTYLSSYNCIFKINIYIFTEHIY